MSYYAYRSSRSSSVAKRRPQQKHGHYIDPKRFVAAATIANEEAYVPQHTFADFALDDLLKSNLAAKGYTVPSPIQDQTIPLGLEGRDVIGIAGTGTGKTAAFALPVLQRLITSPHAFALVIAPTRELAQQIQDECKMLAKGSRLTGAVLIGGTGMGTQLRDLRNNPRIVIGTPGRIKDHLQRNSLRLDKFNMVVLDEVDRMLDMGFVDDVQEILQHTNKTRQAFFFSATISPRVHRLIDSFTNEPVTVSVKASLASENVHQDVVHYRGNIDKLDRLHDLLLNKAVSKAIVFDETQRSVERLNQELTLRGFTTDAIHGGKSQGQRQRALDKFKQNHINILVATDVAARGIDVVDVSHVINYSVPKEFDDYIHRIGRAGRAGKVGYALTFIEHQ